MDYSSNRSFGCRILDYTHKNNKMLAMENELVRIVILVDKGATIYEFIYKPADMDFMWKAPGGLRDASKFIPTSAQAIGFHPDYYEGGWHECFPGGGPYSSKGADFGLHGEVTLMPWSYTVEEDSAERISVSFACETYRLPFRLKKTITLTRHSANVNFEEELTNESNETIPYMWGHHPVLGKPFLDGNCRIDIPAKEFSVREGFSPETGLFETGYSGPWPVGTGKHKQPVDLSLVPSGETPTADLFFLKGLTEGWAAVTNTKQKIGIGFTWDPNVFPYVWYWQVAYGLSGYPWYGRTYNIALEFWTGYPNSFDLAVANGTIRQFSGKTTLKTSYGVILYTGLEKVSRIHKDGSIE